jgi:hypothetical protein
MNSSHVSRAFASVALPALLACADSAGPRWHPDALHLSVRYEAFVSGSASPIAVAYDSLRTPSGDLRIRATVTLTNLGDDVLSANILSGSAWAFRAYDNPDRSGDPVWGDDFTEFPTGPIGYTLQGGPLHLPPGETEEFLPRFIPAGSIVRRGGGAGTYYLAARLRDSDWAWVTDWLPAGSIELQP